MSTRTVEDTWSKSNSKYSVTNYCYPEDVTTSADLQHSMVFFINVRSNSQYKTNVNTLYEVDSNTISQSAITKTALAAGAIGVGTGVAKGVIGAGKALVSSATTGRIAAGGPAATGAIINGALPGAATAIASAGAAAGVIALNEFGFDASKMYRLKTAITMSVQEPRKTSYNVKYEEFDAGTMLGAANVGNLLSKDTAKAELMKLLQAPAAIGAPDFGKALQKMSGQAINPFRTVLFQSVDLRTFVFNYKFMPKSKVEAQNVMNIIKQFKFHMHPEFAEGKVFLIHPAEFNIVYYYKGQETEKWNKISTCVLTNMELDEGADQLSSFADGQSVEINMKLTFMETEMMTKDKILEGY